eukprot:794010_1
MATWNPHESVVLDEPDEWLNLGTLSARLTDNRKSQKSSIKHRKHPNVPIIPSPFASHTELDVDLGSLIQNTKILSPPREWGKSVHIGMKSEQIQSPTRSKREELSPRMATIDFVPPTEMDGGVDYMRRVHLRAADHRSIFSRKSEFSHLDVDEFGPHMGAVDPPTILRASGVMKDFASKRPLSARLPLQSARVPRRTSASRRPKSARIASSAQMRRAKKASE